MPIAPRALSDQDVSLVTGESGDGRTQGPPEVGEALPAEMKTMADRTASPLMVLDRTGRIRYSNPAASRLVGWSPASLVGTQVLNLVHPRDRRRVKASLAHVVEGQSSDQAVEYRVRGADGSWKTLAVFASNFLDLEPSGILVSVTDVTAWRAQEESLRTLALQDPVTGLANRRALRQRLEEAMAHAGNLAVAFIDIDHFKRINDSLGHSAGDTVLQTAASRFAPLVPKESMLAHFGADTFVAVLAALQPDAAVRLVWELVRTLGTPMFVSWRELNLSATAGMAIREPASSPDLLLRDADAALTRAKTHRRGGVEVFTEEMRMHAVERLSLEIDLRHAVERNELNLYLQPVVGLPGGEVVGSESLLRWKRPAGVCVGPDVFIPLAEETGIINAIGDWVLGRALGILLAGLTPRLTINLSPRQLLEPGLPSHVERLLALTGVLPASLAFEVTENVVVENFELAAQSLSSLRQLGCPTGLDDFGSGYSSLGYLRRLPLDFLKLDRELVRDVDTDPQASRIAETIIALGRTLSLLTIAEGIERQSQADALADMGCQYGQGWLFGRPSQPWKDRI
jgi:diguanylate cyclase